MNRLKQRADYTHKRNAKSGRHRWLRLTPAYSLKVVEEILSSYDDASRIHVLNPFCGTGTTALCVAYHGHSHGAQLHYIVGNSTFYNIFVPVERIYAEMLCRLGFSHVEYVPLRKRNSKKELLEFDVRARWQ